MVRGPKGMRSVMSVLSGIGTDRPARRRPAALDRYPAAGARRARRERRDMSDDDESCKSDKSLKAN